MKYRILCKRLCRCVLGEDSIHDFYLILQKVDDTKEIVNYYSFVYCKMVTTMTLANSCTMSHNYHFFFCGEKIKDLLSNFQVYNMMLLAIIIMLYIRYPELIHLTTVTSYSWTNISLFSQPSTPQ